MAWLRIDDGFDSHPKILALGSDQRRFTWMRILIYTCRYKSPAVSPAIVHAIPKANARFIADCVELGLIDVLDDGSMEVHDWLIYNGDTIEAKVGAYLSANPDAGANDVHRAIGGKREIVLAVVKQFQNGSLSVPKTVPNGTRREPIPGSLSGTQSVHARAHPSPSIDQTNQPTSREDGLAGLENEFGNLDPHNALPQAVA